MIYKELKPGDYFTYEADPPHIEIICICSSAGSEDGACIIYSNQPSLIGAEITPLLPDTPIQFITELPLLHNLYDLFDINSRAEHAPLTEPFMEGDQFFFRANPSSEPRFMTMLDDRLAIICNGPNAGEKIFINYEDLTQSSPLLNIKKILKLYD